MNWQGSQIPLICFDELTHFSAKQFRYVVSLNRSMSGVRLTPERPVTLMQTVG
nr:terminase family protein [Sinorhizobium medicae]